MLRNTDKGNFHLYPFCHTPRTLSVGLQAAQGAQTHTAAPRQDSSGIDTRVRGCRVSLQIVCCLCLSRLLLHWRDRWTPATASSNTIHRDCLEKGRKQSLIESSWGGRQNLVPLKVFTERNFLSLFPDNLSCSNWVEAIAFTFTTLDLADHLFPKYEEERKEGYISFSMAGFWCQALLTCFPAFHPVFLSPSDFVVMMNVVGCQQLSSLLGHHSYFNWYQ